MDRTIKFRGKTQQGEWIYGSLVEFYDKTYIWQNDTQIHVAQGIVPVQSDTVGQFTGLYDKDGKEIYEGDMVQNDLGRVCDVSYCIGGGFAGFDLSPVFTFENRLKDVIIIGNIHDNPELL